jgi:CheY-like chemotaxis protein
MNHGTVLIVEDDVELLQLMKIRFESLGLRVLSTSNGDEAYTLTQKQLPDAVILDVFLPDTDGLTILKRLKAPIDIETGQPNRTKDIPIVVVTGKAPMIENMTRIEGAIDFFVKPIDIEKLANRVCQILELTQHERERKSCELTQTRLESFGYQVVCASSGREALDLLEKDLEPSLIILDLDMPEKNGLTTLINLTIRRKMKQEAKKIPIVIATGMHSEQVHQTVRSHDISGYLKKPYGCDELIKTVKDLIG